MTSKVRKTWAICVVTVGLALTVVGTPRARGQTGICCVQTQNITIYCQSQGCRGQVTITQCSGGGYGAGTLWSTAPASCCASNLTTLTNSDGACYTAPAGASPGSTAAFTVPVWVRSCQGQYSLLRLPITS